jgi:hypothetical protein
MNDYRSNNIIPAWYGLSIGPITASSSLQGNLVLEQSSEFELHQIFGSSSEDDPNDPQPNNFSVSITDNGTGRQLMNIKIPQSHLCCPANNGYRLVRPVIFPALCNLLFEVLDLSGNANTVKLTLAGYKIYGSIQ